MTQIGEGVSTPQIAEEDGVYFLDFQLLDERGQPIAGIPYKTIIANASAEPLHIADRQTNARGKTGIVSTTKDEEIECHLVWAKLTVNKGFFKT